MEEGRRFDDIIDDPELLARFMDELIVRVALGTILEDSRYQRAVNQLTVNFFQIGRITDGDFKLPAVNMRVYRSS